MVNMNLLNNLFDSDNIAIINVNKKYFKIMILMLIILIFLLLIKKDVYYVNTYTITDEKIILLANNDYVNKIKETNNIIIDNIENKYSINSITLSNNINFVDISLDTKINSNGGVYKIKIGKERLFDYIIRIIRE